MPAFVVVERGPHRGVVKRDVARWAERMLAALDLGAAELSVVLTVDPVVHALNRTWRGKDRPTDVLAFAQREGEHGALAGDVLGDVVISVETARRQAAARARPVDDEVCMLLAHGLLHLVGYDHRTDAEDRVMRARTRALCRAARLAPPDPGKSRLARARSAPEGARSRRRSTVFGPKS